MAVLKLSQIAAAGAAPAATDQLVGVTTGTIDNLFSLTQIATTVHNTVGLAIGSAKLTGGNTGRLLYDNAGVIGEAIIGTGLTLSGGTLTSAGTPGGSNTQVQYNNSSAFGGITNLTSNGTNPILTAIAAPATPAAGFGVFYVDSTNKVLALKNDAGTVSSTVVPASAGANQFATAISAAGVLSFAQPTIGNLANIAANSILGNNTGSSGPVLALTTAQVTALLGTPTGSAASGDITFWNGTSTLSGDTGLTYTSPGQVTHALGSIAANAKAINITGTFNASGVEFDAPFFMNITNTASAAGSKLIDAQVGGVSLLTLGKTPVLALSNSTTTGTAGLWVYNTVDDPQNPTNYERAAFDFGITSANVLTIGTQKGGTGSTRNLQFVVGGTDQLDYGISTAGQWNVGLLAASSSLSSVNAVGNYNPGAGVWRAILGSGGGVNPGLALQNIALVTWDSSNNAFAASPDLALARTVANVLEINTGTAGTLTGTYLHWGGQARVTADVVISSSTVLANVAGLTVNVAAGRTYSFEVEVSWADVAAAGIQLSMGGTATATNLIFDGWIIDNNAIRSAMAGNSLGNAFLNFATTTSTTGHASIYGTITVNAAGTLTVMAANGTSTASGTTIKRGSKMIVHDMP